LSRSLPIAQPSAGEKSFRQPGAMPGGVFRHQPLEQSDNYLPLLSLRDRRQDFHGQQNDTKGATGPAKNDGSYIFFRLASNP